MEIVKCDMHVHSYFSGPCTTPVVAKFCRESYSDPEEVYSLLRRREMNLFTLTDHDSIEGSEKLRRNPDFPERGADVPDAQRYGSPYRRVRLP